MILRIKVIKVWQNLTLQNIRHLYAVPTVLSFFWLNLE